MTKTELELKYKEALDENAKLANELAKQRHLPEAIDDKDQQIIALDKLNKKLNTELQGLKTRYEEDYNTKLATKLAEIKQQYAKELANINIVQTDQAGNQMTTMELKDNYNKIVVEHTALQNTFNQYVKMSQNFLKMQQSVLDNTIELQYHVLGTLKK